MTTKTANNSAMTGTLRANQIDMTKFQFKEVETNKYGGKSCKVEYNGRPLFIQTPRCRLPYCLGKYEEKDLKTGAVSKTKYSLDFSLGGYELDENDDPINPKMREFYEWASNMEDLLVKKTHENSETWLNMEDATEGVAKALVRPLLRWSKDKVTKKTTTAWPPTVKAKVGFWDGRFTLNAFNDKKERIEDLDAEIVPRTEAIAILKLTAVNFAGGKVGYSFNVHQVKLYAPQGMPAYAFIEDEDDDKPVVTGSALVPNAVDEDEDADEDVGGNTASNMVDDSDDDEDEPVDDLDQESEEEETPTPPPAPKKVIRKKKKPVT